MSTDSDTDAHAGAGMAHHEMPRAGRDEVTGEIGGVVAARVERRKTGETVIARETPRPGLRGEAASE